jgi:DNA-binding response OmpR family regulator
MLDHHIFVWTDDEFIGDVLCFAVQRLGYSCSLFSQPAWNQRIAQQPDDGVHAYAYYLFIVGPNVTPEQREAVLEQAQQARQACQVKVVMLTDQPAPASAPSAADEHAHHMLPLNLRVLHTTLQEVIINDDKS